MPGEHIHIGARFYSSSIQSGNVSLVVEYTPLPYALLPAGSLPSVKIDPGKMTLRSYIAPADGTYVFTSDVSSAYSDAQDPVGYLYDENQSQLAYDNNSADGYLNFRITRRLSAGQLVIIVSASAPGAATIRFETDDALRSSADCTVIIHAQEPMILPAALTTVDEESFANLMAEEIILGSNVEAIGARAFADCKTLVLITLPDDVQIADDAFSGCDLLTILCSEGSTGHTYAAEHGIPHVLH